jgi:hypothetical protein
MVRSASLVTAALLVAAPPAAARAAAAAELPPEPGVYWEQTIEAQLSNGFKVPTQTHKICMPKKQDFRDMKEPPGMDDGRDSRKCKPKDVKRSAGGMSWKMTCEDGSSGEGEMTFKGDTLSGTMTSRMQGMTIQMKVSGRKVGGDCDANEQKREALALKKQVDDQQAQLARAQADACAEAADKVELAAFIPFQPGVPVQCTDTSKLCAGLETRKGLVALQGAADPRGGDARKAVEKLCKKDLAATVKRHCDAAAKEQEKKTRFDDAATLEYVFGYCPDLAKTLAKRECKGRSYTSLPRAQRDFCTRWAEEAMADRGAPAAPANDGRYQSSGVPDVDDAQPAQKKAKKKKAAEEDDDSSKPKDEDMKSKILKGLFGR